MFYALFAELEALDWKFLQALPDDERNAELHRRKMRRIMDKDERMSRRLNRKRAAIWARRWGRFGGAVLALLAIPLVWALICYAWSFAVSVTLS